MVAAGLVLSVVGGAAMWRAVDRLDEAHAGSAAARRDLADVEAVIRARLDESVDRVGLDAGYPTGDTDLRDRLSDVAGLADGSRASQAEAMGLADEIVDREAELREDAAADGAADERLLAGLETALRELDHAVVGATGAEERAAEDAARRTVVVAFVSSSVLWAGAAWLTRSAREEW